MTVSPPIAEPTTRLVAARGSYCPGPLMELIRVIRESAVGDILIIRSSDKGSKTDIPKWVAKAGHKLVGVEEADGYDVIVVEKLH